jgi:hypothetical protein
LRHHYKALHKDKIGVLQGKIREDKLKNLKCDLQWQQNILNVATKKKMKQHFNQNLLYHKYMLRNQKHLWIVYQGVYNEGSRNTLAQKTTAFKNVVFLQVWWLKMSMTWQDI